MVPYSGQPLNLEFLWYLPYNPTLLLPNLQLTIQATTLLSMCPLQVKPWRAIRASTTMRIDQWPTLWSVGARDRKSCLSSIEKVNFIWEVKNWRVSLQYLFMFANSAFKFCVRFISESVFNFGKHLQRIPLLVFILVFDNYNYAKTLLIKKSRKKKSSFHKNRIKINTYILIIYIFSIPYRIPKKERKNITRYA